MNSTKRPILFVSLPVAGLINPLLTLAGELAHRNPLLTLAGELAHRGVADLWFATDEPRRSEIEQFAAQSVVQFVSLGEVVSEMAPETWDDKTYLDLTQSSRFKALRAFTRHTFDYSVLAEKYRRLEAAVEKIQPALMVIDSLNPYAFEVAITRGIPIPLLASSQLTAYVPFIKSFTPRSFPVPHTGLPLTMSLTQQVTNQLFKVRTLASLFNPASMARRWRDEKTHREFGVAAKARWSMSRIDEAEMLLCHSMPSLDYPFPISAKMHLIGSLLPPLAQAPDDEVTEWLNAQSSVIFMSFGTITRLTPQEVGSLVEVAHRLEEAHQILWKLPKDQQEFLPPQHEMTGNLRIESWVSSQLDVLAHPNIKVFFTHAGRNGFHEGLYSGKPQVAKPLWLDCHDQAIRGQDFGFSLTLDRPETIDPADVVDVVDKLTRVLDDSSFRERAEHFGALLREAGGRKAAADLVLGLPAMT